MIRLNTLTRITVALPLLWSVAAAGQTYRFAPDWKVGDTRTVHIHRTTSEAAPGLTAEPVIWHTQMAVEVKAVKPEYCEIGVRCDWLALAGMEPSMLQHLPAVEPVYLNFSVSKTTGSARLLNWEEVRDNVMLSLTDSGVEVGAEAHENQGVATFLLAPFLETLQNREASEAYLIRQLDFLFRPYGIDFSPGIPFTLKSLGDHPFLPGDEVATTTTLTLDSVNTLAGTCVIHEAVEADLESFRLLMQEMADAMADIFSEEAPGAETPKKKDAGKEMEMTLIKKTNYNLNTHWVTRVESVLQIESTNALAGKSSMQVRTEITVE